MIPAKDIMSKDVISIQAKTSILEAIDILLTNKISGMPVIDDQHNLIGIISEKDLLHVMFEDDLDINSPVERFMNHKVVSFREDDDVVKICEFFIKKNFRRVPIVQGRKLVGVISRRDILRLILISALKNGQESS